MIYLLMIVEDINQNGYLGDEQRHRLVTHACKDINHTCIKLNSSSLIWNSRFCFFLFIDF